jgi:hypothetical protein
MSFIFVVVLRTRKRVTPRHVAAVKGLNVDTFCYQRDTLLYETELCPVAVYRYICHPLEGAACIAYTIRTLIINHPFVKFVNVPCVFNWRLFIFSYLYRTLWLATSMCQVEVCLCLCRVDFIFVGKLPASMKYYVDTFVSFVGYYLYPTHDIICVNLMKVDFK